MESKVGKEMDRGELRRSENREIKEKGARRVTGEYISISGHTVLDHYSLSCTLIQFCFLYPLCSNCACFSVSELQVWLTGYWDKRPRC